MKQYGKKVKEIAKEKNKKDTGKIYLIVLIVLIWLLSFTIIIQSILYKELITSICKIIETENEQANITKEDIGNNVNLEREEQQEIEEVQKTDEENIENDKSTVAKTVGKLNIPDINLKNKPIYEGTDAEILNIGIGHFTNTSICNGNVGLASHNSGGKGDEFKNLKNIKIGSEIYYETEYASKTYKVETITEISDEDWSYLAETKDNRITLLTCVTGKPNNRLCVQAIEIK